MDSITNEIIEMIRQRAEVGHTKYGTTMDRTDLSDAQWCQHAIEEALDLAQYLMKIKKRFELMADDDKRREILND